MGHVTTSLAPLQKSEFAVFFPKQGLRRHVQELSISGPVISILLAAPVPVNGAHAADLTELPDQFEHVVLSQRTLVGQRAREAERRSGVGLPLLQCSDDLLAKSIRGGLEHGEDIIFSSLRLVLLDLLLLRASLLRLLRCHNGCSLQARTAGKGRARVATSHAIVTRTTHSWRSGADGRQQSTNERRVSGESGPPRAALE